MVISHVHRGFKDFGEVATDKCNMAFVGDEEDSEYRR